MHSPMATGIRKFVVRVAKANKALEEGTNGPVTISYKIWYSITIKEFNVYLKAEYLYLAHVEKKLKQAKPVAL